MQEKELLLNYYEASQMQMDSAYSGDFKNGNIASDKLQEYNNVIKENFTNYKSVVQQLINSQNPNVVIWISNVALDENFEADFTIKRLKSIAQTESLGIIAFNAKMLLKSRHLI